MFRKLFFVTSLLIMTLAGTVQAQPSLTLSPLSGNLAGYAGSTVGWGFSLTNSADYLLVTSADFALEPTSPVIGTFTDFSGFNSVIVGPDSPLWQAEFDAAAHTGIGSFTISPYAFADLVSFGTIEITYDLYNLSPNDPGFDPDVNLVSAGNQLSAPASVTVAAVPEPSTIVLLGGGVAFICWRGRKRH